MSLIPDEEIKKAVSLNLAPMVDFLFLIVAIFAILAVTRTALFDGEINLVKVHSTNEKGEKPAYEETYVVNLSITEKGEYKWITEFNEYLLDGIEGIKQELSRQQELGLLPHEHDKTRVLLHIDREAKWEPIAQAIFAVREIGFDIHPVYDFE